MPKLNFKTMKKKNKNAVKILINGLLVNVDEFVSNKNHHQINSHTFLEQSII